MNDMTKAGDTFFATLYNGYECKLGIFISSKWSQVERCECGDTSELFKSNFLCLFPLSK